MLKAIIVDDEQNSRENLTFLLKEHCNGIEIIGTAGSVSEAITEISAKNPDLVFLDIEIGEGSGFDVLEKITGMRAEVIFITAFNQYAVKAFKFAAIDYLLKPVDIQELKDAVLRAEQRIAENQISTKLESLVSNLAEGGKKNKKIGLPVSGGIQYFPLEQIIRLQSQSNYTTFFMSDGRQFLISKTLKEYEELLSDQGFSRVHQSHLVNLEFVQQYQKAEGGYVVLSDGTNIPLSKNYKENFIESLNKF
jgi:two-component system LytT family response regulator